MESSVVSAANAASELVDEQATDVHAPEAATDEVVVLDYGGQ